MPEIDNKIYFILLLLSHSPLARLHFKHAYINIRTTCNQLIENYTFHQMSYLYLTKVQSRIPKAYIHRIILRGKIKITAPFYVITFCLLEQISI